MAGERKIDLDCIPGYTVLVRIGENDIWLVAAGKRYRTFFALEGGYEGQSALRDLSDVQRRALCGGIYAKAEKGEDISYSRKAVSGARGTCWIYAQGAFAEYMDGYPAYVMVVTDITETVLTKMQMDAAVDSLEQANRENGAIFNMLDDGIVRAADREGYPVLQANEAFYRMTGYTREQFETECGNRLAGLQISQRQLELAEGQTERWNYRGRDGESHWCRVKVSRTASGRDGGAALCVVFSCGRMPEEAYYQTLIDSYSPSTILIRNAYDLKPLYISRTALRHFDYSKEELYHVINGHKQIIIHPDDFNNVIVPITVPRDNYDYQKEFRAKRKDGTYAWCCEKTVLERRDGEEPVYISTYMDITEMKRNQEQARIGEEEYKVMVAHSGKMVYRYHMKDGTLDVPNATEYLSGLMEPIKSVHRNLIEAGLIARESEGELIRFCDGIYNGEKEGEAKIKCRLNDDGYSWYQGYFSTVYDSDGQPDTVIISIEDITSHMKDYIELRLLKQELAAIATTHTDCLPLKYEVGTHRASVPEVMAGEFGLPPVVEDMPYEMIDGGSIASESVKDFMEIFHDIQRGSAGGRSIIRLKNGGKGLIHYQIDYTTVFGLNGKPDYALIYFRNIEEQYISGMSHAMIRELEDILPDAQHGILSGIIADNRVEEARGGLFRLDGFDLETETLDSIAGSISQEYIDSGDAGRWNEFNNRNWLMFMYDSGIRWLSGDYRLRPESAGKESAGKESAWVREMILLFTSPFSDSAHMHCIFQVLPGPGRKEGTTYGSAPDVLTPSVALALEKQQKEMESNIGVLCGWEQGGGSIKSAQPTVYIRTFGYFDVFVNGQILDFPSRKGKELLALLVDRNGGLCTTEEAISILWENEPMDKITQGRYRQTVMRLKHILTEAGIGDILISKKGGKCVDTAKFTCDLYRFLRGDERYKALFHQIYMTNYSWSENTLALLLAMKQ